MGLFTQRQDDANQWAAIPGEPLETEDTVDTLHASSGVSTVDLGLGVDVTSIVLPVAPVWQEQSGETTSSVDPDPDPHSPIAD